MQNRKCDFPQTPEFTQCSKGELRKLKILGNTIGVFCQLHYHVMQLIVWLKMKKHAK